MDLDVLHFLSTSVGLFKGVAEEKIAALLERDHRQKIPYSIIERVLRTGKFMANGREIDYSAEVEDALDPLRSATLNLISEKWKRGATVEVIYLSGGGAELVHEQVIEAYPQTVLVCDAQLANARGYLNYAHFVARA